MQPAERLRAPIGLQHAIAEILEELGDDRAHLRLVIHDQDSGGRG